MSSRKASGVAAEFQRRVARLNSTRERIELAHRAGVLHVADVEASYAGLFLQAVVAYETAIEDFVLGLLVRPGGVKSKDAKVRARVTVRSFAHALELASGPGSRYPSWIGDQDLKSIAEMLLNRGLPFKRTAPVLDWNYVKKSRYIRNAIAHPSEHAQKKFEKHVVQGVPLPRRERTVAGYLRGRSTGAAQTRWELFVAGLNLFVRDVVV